MRLRRYRILHGRLSVYANTAAPRVPAALRGVVRDVLGLDDVPAAVPAGLVVAGPAKKATQAGAGARAASAGGAPQACAAASTFAAGHLGTPRTIDQVAQAYGIDGLYAQGDFGAGVTVALDELEGYQDEQTDVSSFEQCFGIQPTAITPIEVDGGPGTYSPSAETSVDIQNLIGLAPAVKIDLYQGPNAGAGIYDLMTASVTAGTAQVINWSWGECEATVPASLVAEEGALIQEAAMQGQTFIASSGDRGSQGCISMNADWGPEDNEPNAVEDPTSQPFATSVGASVITSLGQPPAETVWNVRDWGAGGGGVSSNASMPDYQAYSGVPGVISSYSSGTPCGDPSFYCREVPDVSANGGAPQGYAIFYNGAWLDAGGTSTAAPVWTAVAALADASGDSGCSPSKPLGFLNPLLYEIAAGTEHASAFNDITTGSNSPTGSGAYPATPGYDMATGLGSPMATDGSSPGLVAQLCNASLIGVGSAPTITNLSPVKAAAGSQVTITGKNFTPYTAVWFGLNTYASQVTYVSPTELIATVPAGSGTVPVIIFKESGSSGSTLNAANSFTFAPTATISSPANGSVYTQGQSVSAAYSCSSAVSCSGPIASGAALDTSSLGEHSFAVTAKDGTGFTTTATSNYVVVAPPTVAISGPASGATYAQGQVLTAQFSCSASEPLMIQSCSGPVADGAAVDTSTPGSHTFTVSATDSNGVTTSQTVTYTVIATLHASVRTPANGADYVRGSVVHASYACERDRALARRLMRGHGLAGLADRHQGDGHPPLHRHRDEQRRRDHDHQRHLQRRRGQADDREGARVEPALARERPPRREATGRNHLLLLARPAGDGHPQVHARRGRQDGRRALRRPVVRGRGRLRLHAHPRRRSADAQRAQRRERAELHRAHPRFAPAPRRLQRRDQREGAQRPSLDQGLAALPDRRPGLSAARPGSDWQTTNLVSAKAMPDGVLHLSSLAGSPLLDSAGERLGRVDDVIARLDLADPLPPVIGLRAAIGGRLLFVPANRIARLEPGSAHTSTTKLNLAQFERRPGEVLLRSDVLGHSLINVNTARLVRAGEVELTHEDGAWRVAGIDPSFGARVRRVLPRRLRGEQDGPGEFVPWPELEPFVGHVPTSRLRLAHRRIAQLHPAQIADLVEAASHEEGEEILEAVGQDKELEADVFEELDDEHQLEFLDQRSDHEVAAVLARMASDDAADLLLEIKQERRLPVLDLLPAAKQRKIKGLLGYNPSTAGGVMSPDFVVGAARGHRRERDHGAALARRRAGGPQHDPPDRLRRRARGDRHRPAAAARRGRGGARDDRRERAAVGRRRGRGPRGRAPDDRLQPGLAAGRRRRRPPDRHRLRRRRARAHAARPVAPPLRGRARVESDRRASGALDRTFTPWTSPADTKTANPREVGGAWRAAAAGQPESAAADIRLRPPRHRPRDPGAEPKGGAADDDDATARACGARQRPRRRHPGRLRHDRPARPRRTAQLARAWRSHCWRSSAPA